MTLLAQAFHDGAMANQRGRAVVENPYRPSEDQYEAWRCGWYEEEGPAYAARAGIDGRGEVA